MLTDKTEHIISRIRSFITDKSLLNPHHLNPRVGIALSGGADSVALLLVAIELGWHPIALHCNFHLRGEESNRDEQFVDRLCARLGVPLLKKHFNIPQLMSDYPYKGKSVEMVCRLVRYDWFREMRRTQQLTAVALGHHSNDNVETALLNAIRGCGIKGVKGMPPQRDCYIRPLLCISKEDVLKLIEDAGESFVTDSSNLENDYQRNQIRNLILPQIEKCFPGGINRLARTVEYLDENYNLLVQLLLDKRSRYVVGDGDILVGELFANEYHGEILLYQLLDGKLDKGQIANLHNNISKSGKVYRLADGQRMLLDRGVLKRWSASIAKPKEYLCKMPDIADNLLHGSASVVVIHIPELGAKIFIRRLPRNEFHPRRDPSYAWFSVTLLSNLQWLAIRQPRPTDRMRPFGMTGSRLLSDIFTDAKQSLIDKERRLVVAIIPKPTTDTPPSSQHPPKKDEIIWLPGLKNSALYPVLPTDTHILEFHIEYLENNS